MSPFQKWTLWSSSLATGLTGVIYWWMDTMLAPVDEFAVINHPWQPLVLKLHILVAPVMIFAFGLIAREHVWKHVVTGVRRGRASGMIALVVLGPMIASGYLIQAVTHSLSLTILVWIHLATGVLYLVGLLGHKVAVLRKNGAVRSVPARNGDGARPEHAGFLARSAVRRPGRERRRGRATAARAGS